MGSTERKARKTASIELRVEAPQRLFHKLDPSPLVGRDLDEAVEHYIIESARELPSSNYELILHVTDDSTVGGETKALAESIRTYFAYRRDEESRKLCRLLADGRAALGIGLGFLFVCGLLGLLALRTLPAPMGSFLNEGLLIIGWVANWRPVEIFLHGWRPIRRQRDLLGALAQMEVRILRT